MTVETELGIGDRITVSIDGSKYTGKVGEIRVMVKHDLPDPVIVYAGKVGAKRLNPDGKEYTDIRNWFGPFSEIIKDKA